MILLQGSDRTVEGTCELNHIIPFFSQAGQLKVIPQLPAVFPLHGYNVFRKNRLLTVQVEIPVTSEQMELVFHSGEEDSGKPWSCYIFSLFSISILNVHYTISPLWCHFRIILGRRESETAVFKGSCLKFQRAETNFLHNLCCSTFQNQKSTPKEPTSEPSSSFFKGLCSTP